MKFMFRIFVFVLMAVAFAAAHDSIVFNGIVQDDSFESGEKLNVEILETGEALQTTVGTPFSVVLPADTLWNVCVTNSDTAGAAKEKCYELLYFGNDSTFSKTLGPDAVTVDESNVPAQASDSVILSEAQAESKDPVKSSSDSSDVDVEKLLASGSANSKVTELKKVVVQLRRRPKRKPGESVVSAKSIKRMPGLAEADVIKSIQALPGVVASSDFSSKIYVRGGAADQNLFLFDNAVVYSPVHFFGLFSTFLVEGIDDVQFYKSGFPAQYGNRLSSVLKMDGRAGGQDSVEEWFRTHGASKLKCAKKNLARRKI